MKSDLPKQPPDPCAASVALLQSDDLSSSNQPSCTSSELLRSLNGTRPFLSKKPTSIAVAPPTAKFTPCAMSELFDREAGRNGRPNSSVKKSMVTLPSLVRPVGRPKKVMP